MKELGIKENIRRASRLFATQIGVALLSIIVYVFITMFAVSAFSQQMGYEVYIEAEQGGYEYLYSHYYADGEDEKLASYDESKIYKQSIRLLSDKANTAVKIIVQIITAAMFVYLVYGYVWNRGSEDSARTDFEHKEGDCHYGFKLGLLGTVPYFVIYLLVIAEKIMGTSFALSAYKITNFSMFYLIELACNGAANTAQLPVWSFLPLLAILFALPFASWFGYYMGFKNINMRKNLVYGKNNGGK